MTFTLLNLNQSFSSTRPKQGNKAAFGHRIFRDQFTIGTWLLFGAAIQSALFLLPLRPTYIAAPALIVLTIKAIDTVLITFGLKNNPFLEGITSTKHTTLIPNSDGTFGADESSDPSGRVNDKVAVLLLGFRISHPLGLMAPNVKGIGEHFQNMAKDLEDNAATNGFLGMTPYLSGSDAEATKSEIVNVFYFRCLDDVQKFAHGPVHRAGWSWWTKFQNQNRHLSIRHEVYEAPHGRHENVHLNCRPSGITATVFPVQSQKGTTQWISPIFDASRGKLATSAGRAKAYNG